VFSKLKRYQNGLFTYNKDLAEQVQFEGCSTYQKASRTATTLQAIFTSNGKLSATGKASINNIHGSRQAKIAKTNTRKQISEMNNKDVTILIQDLLNEHYQQNKDMNPDEDSNMYDDENRNNPSDQDEYYDQDEQEDWKNQTWHVRQDDWKNQTWQERLGTFNQDKKTDRSLEGIMLFYCRACTGDHITEECPHCFSCGQQCEVGACGGTQEQRRAYHAMKKEVTAACTCAFCDSDTHFGRRCLQICKIHRKERFAKCPCMPKSKN
jgi:hypothetical protein